MINPSIAFEKPLAGTKKITLLSLFGRTDDEEAAFGEVDLTFALFTWCFLKVASSETEGCKMASEVRKTSN